MAAELRAPLISNELASSWPAGGRWWITRLSSGMSARRRYQATGLGSGRFEWPRHPARQSPCRLGPMRERVAAIIEREGRVLMVRQRARGQSGRHDGFEYLTLPGGGVEENEAPIDAIAREVHEEVGLKVLRASYLRRIEHSGGATTLFDVLVGEEPATLGSDPELTCACPRLVGIAWIAAPSRTEWCGDGATSLLRIRLS